MTQTIARGGSLRVTFVFHNPSALSQPVDPVEYPVGPRFTLYDPNGVPVDDPYTAMPYTKRLAPGVYELIVIFPSIALQTLPFTDPGQFYTIRPETATADGVVALVGADGNVPSVQFSYVDGPAGTGAVAPTERLYATTDELFTRFGITPKPSDPEVRFAQTQMDIFMHRNLFPSIRVRERHEIPQDRNLILLDMVPVIRLMGAQCTDNPAPSDAYAAQGRYGFGRRDRRMMNSVAQDYISALAVFGSPPRWQPIDYTAISVREDTGECWLPTGFFLISYSQIEMTYETGLQVITDEVKADLAETIAWIRMKGFSNLTQYSIGGVSMGTGTGFITEGVARSLAKYRVQSYR